jgi:hypothetical protein
MFIFFGLHQGYNFLMLQLGYLGFLIDLTSFPMSLDPCAFFLPFFFEFAHG